VRRAVLASLIAFSAGCSALLGLPDENGAKDAVDAAGGGALASGPDSSSEHPADAGVDASFVDAGPADARVCTYADALSSDFDTCSPLVTCGEPEGAASLDGGLDIVPVTIVDSNAVRGTEGAAHTLGIQLTDFTNNCGYWKSRLKRRNHSYFSFTLIEKTTATKADITVGKFEPGGDRAIRLFGERYEDCNVMRTLVNESAATGFVNVMSITAERVIGEYDLIANGKPLRGTFDAPICGFASSERKACCEPR
jgi:hypothetical protein